MILALAVHLKGFGLALRSVSQVSMAASSSATLLNTPRLPAPNRRLRYPSLALDAIRAEPATRQQHNACACNDFLRRLAISDEPLQCRPVTGPDVQACIDVSHAAVQSDLQALGNPINGSEH